MSAGGPRVIDSDDANTFPRALGDYTLLEPLAVGGMGELYYARRRDEGADGAVVVVKMLRHDLTGDRELSRRFVDEMRTLAHMQHENICQVLDVGDVDGRHYVAVELVGGKSVAELLERCSERQRPVPAAVAVHIASRVLGALHYAHQLTDLRSGAPLHLVHRDVSPANILVSFDGDVKLIDFGVAKSTLNSDETATGILVGKLAYMAPEQRHRGDVDGRADQFCAALVAYELLSGDRYYAQAGFMSGSEMLRGLSPGGWRPPRFRDLPAAFARVLDRALQADRNGRFAHCDEMRRALMSSAPIAGGADVAALLTELFPGERERLRARLTLLTQRTPATAYDDGADAETVRLPARQRARASAPVDDPSATELLRPPTAARPAAKFDDETVDHSSLDVSATSPGLDASEPPADAQAEGGADEAETVTLLKRPRSRGAPVSATEPATEPAFAERTSSSARTARQLQQRTRDSADDTARIVAAAVVVAVVVAAIIGWVLGSY